MEQPNPTFAKILILDIGKFEQWKFRIQQYIQNEHYALWEVIEFGDSYKAPQEESGIGSASESSAKKKGRTVAVTTEDMQKRRNDVKNMAFISSAKNSSGKGEVNIASIPTANTHVSPASADVAAASISLDITGKKITIQGTDVPGFDKSKVECFNCHKIGWDWRYMANEEENHALVADEEAPTEFALMAKSSSSFENEGNSQNIIDDKGYWDSGCSRHMTDNISYLSDYEPYDGGYVSFGQGGGKILVKVSSKLLKDDTNVLLRTPRQHNMYSIDLNSIVPHKDLTYLVAKASADESMLWHRRLDLKLKDDTNVLLRTPRQHNMYSIDL
nr:ribonuclease H-like domain-containing protein [Tanacetum cinerariifolium]